MRSTSFLLFALPILLLGCGSGFSAVDVANDDAAPGVGGSPLGGAGGGSSGSGGSSTGLGGGGTSDEGGAVGTEAGTTTTDAMTSVPPDAKDAAPDRVATVDAAGPACKASHDCAVGLDCLFDIKKGCDAEGVCMKGFDPTKPICNAISPACSCSGNTVNVICNGLPSGYYSEPIAHSGAC